MPTAFQDSNCVRGELKPRKYQVRPRYQVRANALLFKNNKKTIDCLCEPGTDTFVRLLKTQAGGSDNIYNIYIYIYGAGAAPLLLLCTERGEKPIWPLHDIVTTNIVWCMAY